MNNATRISTRLFLLILIALVGLVSMAAFSLANLRNSLLEDRKVKTKNLVEVGLGIIEHNFKLVQAGKLSVDEGKLAARASLRELRYGDKDYFFVIDSNHNYVLLPPKPEIEGENRKDWKDSHGKFFIQEIVSQAVNGGGFTNYAFPRAGQSSAEPKLSYTTLFAPWGWVIGTGIYIDDVDKEFRQQALLLGGIALLLVVALIAVGWRIRVGILNQLGGEPAEAAAVMKKVAAGDLSIRPSNAPEGSLLHSLDAMVVSLREIMAQVTEQSRAVVSNAESISGSAHEVAQAAHHQADATSSMAAAIEEMTVSSNYISENAQQTESYSREASNIAIEGTGRVRQATLAIERIAETVTQTSSLIHALNERSIQVSSITGVIKEIAGQTNLLALNAAIEAARAGETGRGFAVVADEVRKLAERTANATTEIEQMLGAIQNDTEEAVTAMNSALPEVEQGVQASASVAESLHAIEEGAHRTLERVVEIANSTKEQSSTSTSIAQRVEQIAEMVEETSRTMENNASSAKNLEQVAANLQQIVGKFKLS